MDDLGRLSHLSAIITIHRNQIERALAWEKDFNTLDTAADELTLFNPRVLIPRHEAVSGKLLELTAEEMAAVLAHKILVSLEEVKDEVVNLRIVRLS